jgi:hypothetical protein
VAERHGCRHAGLAGQDLPAVLRGEQAEVEHLDFEAAFALDDAPRDLDQAKGLRHLARSLLPRDEPLTSRMREREALDVWSRWARLTVSCVRRQSSESS